MVGAERHQQAERRDHEPGPERPHVEERAAEEHQAADADECGGRDVRGVPEEVAQAQLHLLPDDAALPAEVREAREEEPERGQAEAGQLGVRCARRSALGGAPFVRFLTREGVRGRSRRFFFLAAMWSPLRRATPQPLPPQSAAMLRAARLAVSVVFFASGAAYGNFVARIPALKEKLEASDAELGLVLFGGRGGRSGRLPVAGWLSAGAGKPPGDARGAARGGRLPAAARPRTDPAPSRSRSRSSAAPTGARRRHERARRRGRGAVRAADLLLVPRLLEPRRARRRRAPEAAAAARRLSARAVLRGGRRDRGDLRVVRAGCCRATSTRRRGAVFGRPSGALVALAALAFARSSPRAPPGTGAPSTSTSRSARASRSPPSASPRSRRR